MNLELNIDKLRKDVIALGKKYPHAIYQGTGKDKGGNPICRYTKGKVLNGPPTRGCLIGQAIRIQLPDFKEPKKVIGILGLFGTDVLSAPYDLSDCQSNQDLGEPWGECISNLK